jgi:transcriptional regulator with XRE-family HTH domain
MDKKWLRDKLQNKGISQRKLSALLGLDPGSMSRTVNGTRRLQVSEAAEISLIFGETLDEVLFRFGVIGDGERVSIKLSGVIGSDCYITPSKTILEVDPPESQIGKLDCVQIRCPHPLDRSLVFFGEPVAVVTERMALHLLKSGKVVIGVANRGYSPKKYSITTLFNEVMESEITSSRIVVDITPI